MRTVDIDYLTLRLTDSFDFYNFEKLIENHISNPETGEDTGPALQAHQFRIKTMVNGTVVVSFYSGGEEIGLELHKKYNLPVTRLDLCVDLDTRPREETYQAYEAYCQGLHAFFQREGITVSNYNFDGKQTSKNGAYGSVFYSRQSQKQLRIYAKRTNDEDEDSPMDSPENLRIEWQLRGDLARAVLPEIMRGGLPIKPETLFTAFQSVTAQFLEPDFFGLGDSESLLEIDLPKKTSTNTSFEHWALVTIPTAFYRHFKSTGVDLMARAHQEFMRKIEADSLSLAEAVKTKERAAIEATKHRLRAAQLKVERRYEDSHLDAIHSEI